MALLSYYDIGFASVANGSTAVTGTGTQWLTALRENDIFLGKDGRSVRIASIESASAMTLAHPWPGTSQTDDIYEVRITPAPSEITASVRELLEKLRQGLWLTPNATGTLAERAGFDSARRGFIYMQTDVTPFVVFVKQTDTAADWSPGYSPQQGPAGPYADIEIGATTTLAPGASATVTPTPTSDGVSLAFGVPAGEGFYFRGAYVGATAYQKDDVVTSGGSSFIALQETTGNAPNVAADTAFWARIAVKGQDGTGVGDMVAANYDPQAIGADVFDRANHTGVAPFNSVDGLGGVVLPTDGVTDVLATLVAAQDAGDVIRVPAGTYFLSDKIDILDDKLWYFDNVTLTHSDVTKSFLSVVGKKRFALLGKLRIQGTRTTTETGAEVGLILENCEDFIIEDVVARGLAGKGFDIRGATAGTYFGAKGFFANLLAVGCTVGYDIQAGSGAEYGTWSNCSAVGNSAGVRMAAGNHTWAGGTITDNSIGVDLVAGSNHLHGSFVGTLINHNTTLVRGIDVTMGHTFADCRFYAGAFDFEGCANIVIEGGVMDDVTFTNDAGTAGSFNYVRNVNFPGDTPVSTVAGDAPGNIRFSENYGPGITRGVNAPSEHYSSVYQAGEVALADGAEDPVVFGVRLNDTNFDYDTATGIFTAPVSGLYRITVNALFNATTITEAASYLDLQTNTGAGQPFGSATLMLPTRFGDGKLRFNEACDMGLDAGFQFRILANIAGTAPKFGDTTWLSLMNVEKVG